MPKKYFRYPDIFMTAIWIRISDQKYGSDMHFFTSLLHSWSSHFAVRCQKMYWVCSAILHDPLDFKSWCDKAFVLLAYALLNVRFKRQVFFVIGPLNWHWLNMHHGNLGSRCFRMCISKIFWLASLTTIVTCILRYALIQQKKCSRQNQ